VVSSTRDVAFLAAVLGKSGTQRDKEAVEAMRNALPGKREGHEGCILLVLPGAVTQQWYAELDRWGFFAVAKLFHGKAEAYERALEDVEMGRAEVAICSYDFLRTHAECEKWGKIKSWRLVVFDEVHAVKNRTTQRTLNAKVRYIAF
jgi:SNF2 family DNA or RNA helicase